MLEFIDKRLEPWTEARQAANDWRLMFLDAYAPHLTKEVASALWAKGYIPVYHGGGTTGVCQVNDTDLHAAFEREYLNCEALTVLDQQMVSPGDIGRSRQQAPYVPVRVH